MKHSVYSPHGIAVSHPGERSSESLG